MSHLNYKYQKHIMKRYILNKNNKYLIDDVTKLTKVIESLELNVKKRNSIEK